MAKTVFVMLYIGAVGVGASRQVAMNSIGVDAGGTRVVSGAGDVVP